MAFNTMIFDDSLHNTVKNYGPGDSTNMPFEKFDGMIKTLHVGGPHADCQVDDKYMPTEDNRRTAHIRNRRPDKPTNIHPIRQIVCRDFNKPLGCPVGISCRFVHVALRCAFYHGRTGCRNGDRCSFIHTHNREIMTPAEYKNS